MSNRILSPDEFREHYRKHVGPRSLTDLPGIEVRDSYVLSKEGAGTYRCVGGATNTLRVGK